MLSREKLISNARGGMLSVRVLVEKAHEQEWKMIDSARRQLERPAIAAMDEIFEEQRQEALAALSEFRGFIEYADRMKGDPPLSERARIISTDALFNFAKWAEATFRRLSRFFEAAIFGGYDVGLVQIDTTLPDLTSQDPSVRALLDTMARKTKNISLHTQERIADLVDQALREGWSIDQTAQEIDLLYDGFKAHRSATIAQTNITAGFSQGQNIAFARAGVRKRWLTQRDGRVRTSHQLAEGQERNADDKFNVGLAELRFPGDPETDQLKEIMNCRCAILPVR